MNAHTQIFLIDGAVGALECALDLPDPEQFTSPRGLAHMRGQYPDLPLALAGFSFGTFVQAQLQQRLTTQADPAQPPAERLALVGTAAGKWPMPEVAANTILIHGELDDTIPLSAVLDWARPQELPVVVIPGADHFFHRRLQHIKNLVVEMWHR